jgi:uncharacterized RDD family membrane protein YckC
MSSTEPPAGSTPPGSTPPPPPPAGAPGPTGATPPPPPPPPPAGASYGTAPTGAPAPGVGIGQPGSLMDRFLARLLDSVIVGLPTVIVVSVLGAVSGSWLVANLIAGVLYAGAYLGYFAYFESNRGAGIGKQVLKLRVEGPGGGLPTMEQAVRRNIWLGAFILYVIPIFGPLFGGLLILAAEILIAVQINSDPQRQHYFDKLAGGTKVVKVG